MLQSVTPRLSPVIRTEKLRRVFQLGEFEVEALKGVDLSVAQGEFLAIMGSSGSGKSTLMNILGCLDRPSSGRYLLQDVDVATLSEPELARLRSAHLGFVFQSFNLLARTSALENVALPLYYAATGPLQGKAGLERARKSLAFVGLGDREKSTPGQLSGGQQQRVAIARALVNSPSLVLADEPTGNLDTKTSHEIMRMLVDLNRRHGVTIVLVTHEADIAQYADRIVTMRDGRIIADETVSHPTIAHDRDEPAEAPAPPMHKPVSDGGFRAMMGFFLMVLGAAAQAINRNRMRSALTMLGVFIGVAALIVMVAVGNGASAAVRKQIENLGTNLIVVVPGAVTTGGVRGGFGSASTLTVDDAEAIARQDPAVAGVGYVIRQQGQVQFASRNWTTSIQGVSEKYPPITNWRIASGRGFTAEDEARASLVAVIGQTITRQLFGPGEDPVGATIQVHGAQMKVIGTLAAKGQSPFGTDQDDLVMIPFTTAERKVLGVAAPSQSGQAQLNWPYPAAPNPFNLPPRLVGYANQIFVQAASQAEVPKAIAQVTNTLVRRHRIRDGDLKDFDVRNLSQFVETAESSSRIMSLLLASVASISLLVGGIGIMNILLVSVTERTREIGLRMAIGARRLHVLEQFLAEAVFLSVSGGIAGILMGIAVSLALPLIFGWTAPVSLPAIAGGFAFAAAVGVFFGFYPARKAASLNPIDALRYE